MLRGSSLFVAIVVGACVLPSAAVAAQPSFAFTDRQFVAEWNKQNGNDQGMTIDRLAPAKPNVERIVFNPASFIRARGKMAKMGLVPAATKMKLGGSLFIDPATHRVLRIELTGERGDFLNLANHDGNIVGLIRYFGGGISAEKASTICNETLGGMRGDDDPRCGTTLSTVIGKARISHLVRPSSQTLVVVTQAVPASGR